MVNYSQHDNIQNKQMNKQTQKNQQQMSHFFQGKFILY